jgi:hypothetical protein
MTLAMHVATRSVAKRADRGRPCRKRRPCRGHVGRAGARVWRSKRQTEGGRAGEGRHAGARGRPCPGQEEAPAATGTQGKEGDEAGPPGQPRRQRAATRMQEPDSSSTVQSADRPHLRQFFTNSHFLCLRVLGGGGSLIAADAGRSAWGEGLRSGFAPNANPHRSPRSRARTRPPLALHTPRCPPLSTNLGAGVRRSGRRARTGRRERTARRAARGGVGVGARSARGTVGGRRRAGRGGAEAERPRRGRAGPSRGRSCRRLRRRRRPRRRAAKRRCTRRAHRALRC